MRVKSTFMLLVLGAFFSTCSFGIGGEFENVNSSPVAFGEQVVSAKMAMFAEFVPAMVTNASSAVTGGQEPVSAITTGTSPGSN